MVFIDVYVVRRNNRQYYKCNHTCLQTPTIPRIIIFKISWSKPIYAEYIVFRMIDEGKLMVYVKSLI